MACRGNPGDLFLNTGLTEPGEVAPGRLRALPGRARQIAPSPAERTRGSSPISLWSMPSNMDSPGFSKEIGKRARLRPVSFPSLRRGPVDRRGGSVPARQAGSKDYSLDMAK